MKKKIKFELLSDVMVGGVRITDNFLQSEEFISGSVLRSAFANDILLECPYSEDVSLDGRKYIVEKKEKEKCVNCSKKNICEKFSEMYFSFLYKDNSIPAPLTSKICKAYEDEHPIKDIIAGAEKIECSECKTLIKRMEDLKGFIKLETNGEKSKFKRVKVDKNTTIHTAINYNTRTAKEGTLFEIRAIEKGQFFDGVVDDCDTGMIYENKIIYLGKYSSSGFGKMKIVSVSDYTEENIEENISRFNDKFNKSSTEYNYATIYLKSDAKLGFENDSMQEILSTDEYKNKWKQKLFENDEIIKVEQVFAQNILYSGYDTSSKMGKWKKDVEIITLKGSSFKISYKKVEEEKVIKKLYDLVKTGVGNDTKAGYGEIEICNKIHMLGV